MYDRQVRGLLEGGVDGFILETFSDVDELERGRPGGPRATRDLPIIAQMTVGTDGKTHYGTDPAVFGPELAAMGADVIGVNCSVGPHGVLEAVEKLARVVSVPISAQPNAGLPREVGDRKIYMASPEYMASYARRMVEAGARFVGGCCGTTPDHIRAIVGFVQSVSPRHAFDMGTLPAPSPAVAIEPVPLAARSRLGAKLAEGRFVTTVEIVPPKGVDPAPMFEQVRQLKAAGVDAVNVPDGPRAQSRMGALLSAADDRARGRARGGGALRLPGPQPARHALRSARRGRGGHPQPAHHHRRSAEDGALPRGHRGVRHRQHRAHQPGQPAQPRARSRRQSDRPADQVRHRRRGQSRPRRTSSASSSGSPTRSRPARSTRSPSRCSTSSSSTGSSAGSRAFRIPIIAGIWPLVSLRNAEFLANEVPGVSVPDDVVERMRAASAGGKEEALAEGVRISREMLVAVADRVQGVQVSAPLGRVPVALEVLRGGAD